MTYNTKQKKTILLDKAVNNGYEKIPMKIYYVLNFYRAMLCIRSTSHGPVS